MKVKECPGRMGAALAILCSILLLSLAPSADAVFGCSVKTDCSGDEADIFHMSALDNAHAELPSQSSYSYKVCCGGVGAGIVGNSCSGPYAVVLNLSSLTNAHVSDPFWPPYTIPVCISIVSGNPWCSIISGSCTGGSICFASISADTNAHVGDCSAYARKVCCFVNKPPTVTDITPPPGDDRNIITFTATAIDPDGDPVQAVEFNVSFTGGSRSLGTDAAAPFQATWNSLADTGPVLDPNVIIRAKAFDGVSWGPWREEYFTVNNTPAAAWFTAPANWTRTGRIFNVTWNANGFAGRFDFQYTDRATFQQVGGAWTSVAQLGQNYVQVNLTTASDGDHYCFRLVANDSADGINGTWSCNPLPTAEDPWSVGRCTCITLDALPPAAVTIDTKPLYTNFGIFTVNWSGSDTGAGVECYRLRYRVYDNKTGAVFLPWTDWNTPNDMMRLVYVGGGRCAMVNCTTSLGFNFNRGAELPLALALRDNQTTEFNVSAVDAAYGCANNGSFVTSENKTHYDRTPPPDLNVSAWDMDGNILPSPLGTVYTPSSVDFNVTADPSGLDYTGLFRTGVRYWLSKPGSGYVITSGPGGIEMICPDYATTCLLPAGPWYKDYKVTYIGFAVDRAGNENTTLPQSFLALKPLKLEADTDNVYMTLGSNRIVTLTVSNRQSVNDIVKVRLLDYPYAKFMNDSGVLWPGERDVNVTLLAKETKTIHVLVYTSEIGEDYSLLIVANTTRPGLEAKVEDMVPLDMRVVMPHEFPELGPWAIVLIVASSAIIYALFSGRRFRS